MYVEDVKDGVCGFYATLHTEYCYLSHSCRRRRRYYSIVLCIQGPSPLQGGRLFIWAFRPVGLAVHHHVIRGGSFVNFLGLVKLQGWLQARRTAKPQFLNAMGGTQQPGNSYISMGTKLHPPYPDGDRIVAKISKKLRIKWNFELTVFELTVPDLYMHLVKNSYLYPAEDLDLSNTQQGVANQNLTYKVLPAL